jgi:hypothetical protein
LLVTKLASQVYRKDQTGGIIREGGFSERPVRH